MSYCKFRGRILIQDQSHTFVEIDHDLMSMVFHSLPLNQEGIVVGFKGKYVHKLLVNCLFKPVQAKVWLDELTLPA